MASPPQKGPPSVADSDDISLISDDDATTVPAVATRVPAAAVPQTWAQVDAPQLRQLAHRIAQRTLPDADKSAEPLIISPSSPSAARALPHDPLGLGVAPATVGGDWAPDDPRLQPSSPAYDPEFHAVAAYRDVPWEDLVRGLERLRTEVREHTGQLKALVKENFDRFLSTKDTVDDISARLQAAEAEGGAGVHGATPGEVADGVSRSRASATAMFGQLLDRHVKGESLHAMLGMLGEYDSLVGLPAQVRACTEARDFAGVLALYRKAVKIVEERGGRGGGAPDSHAVWEKLQAEVDRAMASAVHVLLATVESPGTALAAAAEAAQHLGALREAGVPAAADVDPVALFLAAQGRAVTALIANIQAECTAALAALDAAVDTSPPSLQRWWELEAGSGEADAVIIHSIDALEALWAIKEAFSAWAVELWAVTVGRAAKDADFWASRRRDVETAAVQAFEGYEEATVAASEAFLRSDAAWEACGGMGAATPLTSVFVSGCLALQGHVLADKLRDLVSKVAEAGAAAAEARLAAAAQGLAAEALAVSPCAAGLSSLPPAASSLRLLLCCGMRWVTDLQAQCARAGAAAGARAAQPHRVLCPAASAFVASVAEQAKTTPPEAVPDRQLLQAWAAVQAAGASVLPQVAAAWEASLGPEAAGSVRNCCKEAESAGQEIVKSYLDRKLGAFDAAMEEFLSLVVPTEGPRPTEEALSEAAGLAAGWGASLAPRRARPVAWALLAALGSLRAELLAAAPRLCADVMTEVLQGVVGGVAELIDSGFLEGAAPEAIYQLWVDVTVVAAALSSGESEFSRDADAELQGLCAALEAALATGLKRCAGEGGAGAAAYAPPGSGGAGGREWTAASMGDHRRWVQKVCTAELGRSGALFKAFLPVAVSKTA